MAIVGASFGVVQGQTKRVVYEYLIVTTYQSAFSSGIFYTNSKGEVEETPLENQVSVLGLNNEKNIKAQIHNNQILTKKLNELSSNGFDLYQTIHTNYFGFLFVHHYLRKPIE